MANPLHEESAYITVGETLQGIVGVGVNRVDFGWMVSTTP